MMKYFAEQDTKDYIMKEKAIKKLTEQGYTILPQMLTKEQVSFNLNYIQQLYKDTKDNISQDTPYLNQGQPNVYNLQNKNKCFIDLLLRDEIIEEILKHFLNDRWYKQISQNQPNYILRSFGARSSNEALPLHIDSFIPYKGDEVIAMQVAIMLENSTIENGCTIVVPGSHQTGEYARNDKNKMIISLEAKAGDVIIWDSRLWHGTTKNNTDKTRWAIIATFCRYWLKQQFNITESLPPYIYNQLTPKEKSILGFCSVPPLNEFEGIEMKKGYESLD